MPAAPSDPSGALADRELVERALRRLDPGHRAVVALHYLLGMPLPEVAATLGIPLGTAKSRLHYALAAMRGTWTAETPSQHDAVAGGQVRMTVDRRFERHLPDILDSTVPGRDARLPR